ncbi:L-type lectin-domain containing receptor kinase IX.2-like [Phragmites australis]|uniref:L-type lectin-domain containing receptor kinase IX.2-like n=1 Tax=Phragmites australis TaxID=29695 RepID=UPI002D7891A9|nr:L-type lectin-domain containing receptor kinase IX.2-like [Phragmites australis]
MAQTTSPGLPWRSIFLLLLPGPVGCATSLSFFYNFSNPKTFSQGGDLYFEGDAYAGGSSVILAKDQLTGNVRSKAGRVSYNHPVTLWTKAAGDVTGFSTSFSFVINGSNSPAESGGGLAFFLAAFPSRMPLNSEAGYLGVFNSTTTAGRERVVAVELDTHGDFGWDTTMSPHIGVDLNTISSEKGKYKVVQNLADGLPKVLQVDYSDVTKDLVIALRDFTNGTTVALKMNVDLGRYLPQQVAMGLSAATGGSRVDLHQVLWWSFSTTTATAQGDLPIQARYVLEAPANSSAPPLAGRRSLRGKSNIKVVVGSVVSAVLFAVTALVVACLYCISKKSRAGMEIPFAMDAFGATNQDIVLEELGGELGGELSGEPRYSSYDELLDVTDNFSEERLLGDVRFSSFYLGGFSNSDRSVAVKKLKIKSEEALRMYMERIRVLTKCRHGNLVCLLDSCREGDNLYLVYEFVENGSLAEHLYNNTLRLLTWPTRYKIVLGMGVALEYLHGAQRREPVLHGNIKPSNVMLDESFNAKLGDFGLPQQIHHDQGSAKLAETQGYMAPEFLATGEASIESDVYSFGVVLLEIACGLPPLLRQQDQNASLVERVGEMYQKGAILEAADVRLNGEFDEGEMERVLLVGLMCADPSLLPRPSIGQAMGVLTSDQPVPVLLPRMAVPPQVTHVNEARSEGHTLPDTSSP